MIEKEIFECQLCGYCCQGETTVSLDETDKERMADYLNLPYAEVEEKYLRVNDNVVQMKIVDGHCIFYQDGCTIHTGKPWRCSQWPLHSSMLSDKANYESIKESCPGISREMDYDEFCRKLAELLKGKE